MKKRKWNDWASYRLPVLAFLSCTYAKVSNATIFSFSVPSTTATVVANTSVTLYYTITNISGSTLSNVSFVPPANLSAFINQSGTRRFL